MLAPGLEAPPGTPLYVHVPFCVVKCSYCDFFSVAARPEDDLDGTVDALLLEAQRRAPREPRTMFLGGGTPTFLSEGQLARLLDGLEAATGYRGSASEVTVECNPESLTPAKAGLLRRAGVNRLSIGVQSLDPAILALFDRPHSVEDSFRAYDAARGAGFERVSLDLIFGVPGQDLRTWIEHLDRLLDLEPDHVSAYSLAFEEGTALTKMLAAGRLERLPEDLDLAFFLATRSRLEERGYLPYEVSNFCPTGQRCAHNENYWANGPYVGLGPGAVSKLGPTRFGNPRSIPRWRIPIERGESAASWEETLTPVRELGQTWWLGLRTLAGVTPSVAREIAGFDGADDPAEALALRLGREGFLETGGGAWRLTDRGLPVADAVSARFLQDPGARATRDPEAAR